VERGSGFSMPSCKRVAEWLLCSVCLQSVPTHEALVNEDVVAALMALLSSPNPLVVEHAASVFSVISGNSATHFQVGFAAKQEETCLISCSIM
jgi:hypothetical protein